MKIKIANREIDTITIRKCRIFLEQNNTKTTCCKDCEKKLEVGEGVYRKTSFGNGYICFNCLRSELLARTYDSGFPEHDAGFHFDSWNEHTISQCFTGYPPRQFKTEEILQAVRREWKYDLLDRMHGQDVPAPQRLEDALDSFHAES